MTPKTAASLLSLPLSGKWREDTIQAAFKYAVTQAHPDVGGHGGDIARLKKARDVLLFEARRAAEVGLCPACEGEGATRTKKGRHVTCTKCGGTGEYRRVKDGQ